ncbi:transposase [Sphingomonas sp.]|uniref:transposase n=1 Tax=Sphingomonas sp. TaxID=28214 RepID=UPI003FA75F7B
MCFTLHIGVEGELPGEFWLNDEQWDRLRPLLPNKPRGVPRSDDRGVISGIVHVLQAGCRWKDASSAYGRTRRCIIGISVGRKRVSGRRYSKQWPPQVGHRLRF